MKKVISFFRRIWRNGVVYPITQKIVSHEQMRDVIVYTYIGERCIHVSEVMIEPMEGYLDRLDRTMDRDRKSAKVFRDVVYSV